MSNYLTIKQAAATTGISDRQIRRLCYDAKSKAFVTHDEKGRLLVDAGYLGQHYPLVKVPEKDKNDNGKNFDMTTDVSMVKDETKASENLRLKVALLEQEVRQKNEIIAIITDEKDKRIEILERALLLLGEGQKQKEISVNESTLELPIKRKSWWNW